MDLGNKVGKHNQHYKNEEMIGLRFHDLVVTELAGRNQYGHYLFKCQCDCGRSVDVVKGSLIRNVGGTKSCGCRRTTAKSRLGDYRCGGILRQNIEAYMPNGEYSSRLQQRCVSIKKNIRKRAKESNLLDADIIKLAISPCFYCKHVDQINGIGIDRLDPKIGYLVDNCVPCCKHCNFAKNDMTEDAFKAWLERICYNYLKVS